MFPKYLTEGFIFKKEDIGEADRIYSIYTRDFGKIEILGKGIRKISAKLRSAMELFSFSKVEFIKGKKGKRLTDAFLIERFSNIRNDLKRLKIAFKISKLLDSLIKGEEKDERILELILETFYKLNDYFFPENLKKTIFYYFFWNILNLLGYGPQVDICILCQRKVKTPPSFFSFKEKGFLCSNCGKKEKKEVKIERDSVKLIKIFLNRDLGILERIRIKKKILSDLKDFSEKYLEFLQS